MQPEPRFRAPGGHEVLRDAPRLAAGVCPRLCHDAHGRGGKCSANEEKFFVYSIDPSSTRSLPRLGGLISLPT